MNDLVQKLRLESLLPVPSVVWPDDIVHPSDLLLATDRRRVLLEAVSGFRVRPLRTYRQRTPEEMADTPSLARSRRAA